jgi:hypothetical protein
MSASAAASILGNDSQFSDTPAEPAQPVSAVVVLYTNYRGETALRTIVPIRIWFGSTDWHREGGWLLDAFDVEKGAERSFAMKDIRVWLPELK